jgi:hypothetical protein
MSTIVDSIWEIIGSSLGILPIYYVFDVLSASKVVIGVVFLIVTGGVLLVLRGDEIETTISILPLPQSLPLLVPPLFIQYEHYKGSEQLTVVATQVLTSRITIAPLPRKCLWLHTPNEKVNVKQLTTSKYLKSIIFTLP